MVDRQIQRLSDRETDRVTDRQRDRRKKRQRTDIQRHSYIGTSSMDIEAQRGTDKQT